MQNQSTFKPTIFSSCIVSIIMGLIGLSALFFGLIYLVGAANADPIDNLGAKPAILGQGQIVALLTFLYAIIYFISLVFWYKGWHNWNYVILGLGLLHLAGSTYLVTSPQWESDLARLFFYGSLTMNLLLVIITIFGRRKLEAPAENSNA